MRPRRERECHQFSQREKILATWTLNPPVSSAPGRSSARLVVLNRIWSQGGTALIVVTGMVVIVSEGFAFVVVFVAPQKGAAK